MSLIGTASMPLVGHAHLRASHGLDDSVLEDVRAVGASLSARIPELIGDFYRWLAQHAEFERFFTSEPLLARVKGEQAEYWRDFLRAEVDDAYVERRRNVGEVHARIELGLLIYLEGMEFVSAWFRKQIEADERLRARPAVAFSIRKLIKFDSWVVVDTYASRTSRNLEAQRTRLEHVAGLMRAVTEGDLRRRIEVTGPGDVLGTSLDDMVRSLRSIAREMGHIAGEDSSGIRTARAKSLPHHLAGKIRERGARRPAVLIVDDVESDLLALEATLSRDDIEIFTALSGRAALGILAERDVALAIVDVEMPEMDGFELATIMRGVEKTRCIPIVLVTDSAASDPSRLLKGYESGAVDYLFKLLDERILRSKVDVFVMLEKQREERRRADRMRETFVGILGHDLRNPLNAILMSAQTILSRSHDDQIVDVARRILRGGDRMTRLIEQLLDASRFRNGVGPSLVPNPADLRELAAQIVSEFEAVRPRFQIDVSGDSRGAWDTDRLLQVMSNLVGNAVRYSPPDSPIRIGIDGQRESVVVFQVHNHGAPIPKELRGTLFEPFRRSTAGDGATKGLGLGLYITMEIVRAHGGSLSYESSEGSGTYFTVRIPRHTG